VGIFLYRHLALDFMFFILYFFIRRPSDSTVMEEAGFEVEPRTLALEIRPSNPQSRQSSSPPPPWVPAGGGDTFACGKGVVVPIRTMGQTLCYSRYISYVPLGLSHPPQEIFQLISKFD
jgi:hypothetical protein